MDFPEMLWEGIGLTEEVRIEAENAAGCAAQAEGERCSRLPEEEFRDLVQADELFDGDDTDECPSYVP